MTQVVFNTDGRGLWSNQARPVTIVDMQLGPYISEELDFGELRVQFDDSWDVNQHGLIYTDERFIRDLRRFLHSHGLPGHDVSYSEQGMQGEDFVSLDVGGRFLKAWAQKFNVNLQDMVWA